MYIHFPRSKALLSIHELESQYIDILSFYHYYYSWPIIVHICGSKYKLHKMLYLGIRAIGRIIGIANFLQPFCVG